MTITGHDMFGKHDPYSWAAWRKRSSYDESRELARALTKTYALVNPDFMRVLTAAERREQYADYYARTIMRLTA